MSKLPTPAERLASYEARIDVLGAQIQRLSAQPQSDTNARLLADLNAQLREVQRLRHELLDNKTGL